MSSIKGLQALEALTVPAVKEEKVQQMSGKGEDGG